MSQAAVLELTQGVGCGSVRSSPLKQMPCWGKGQARRPSPQEDSALSQLGELARGLF